MKKIKKYKWGKYLPHIIIEKPSEVKFDDFNYDVERADDHYFINNEDYYSGNFYLYLGIGAFIFSSIGFTFENSKERARLELAHEFAEKTLASIN